MNQIINKKKISEEEKIFFKTILNLVDSDTDFGRTSLPGYQSNIGHAIEYARYTYELELFLKGFVKHSYRDMVLKPDIDKFNCIKRTEDSWRSCFVSYLPYFIFFARNLPPECIYSERIETFLSVCKDYSLPEYDDNIEDFCRDPIEYFRSPKYRIPYNQMRVYINGFFRDLYERLREPKTLRKILDRERAVKKNYKEYIRLIEKLFERYARLVVLRIDLGYKKEENANIEDLVKDINHIHGNKRHNKLFSHLVGYMEKIEFGMQKGAHAHLLLFFDGSKRKPSSDVYIAKEIGEYWVNQVTKGRGVYWNCNAEKARYEANNRLGIGEIHVTEDMKIQNLYRIVEYFCKSEQYVKPRTRPKMKLMRKSVLPKLIGAKKGAPRKSLQKDKLSVDTGTKLAA